MQRPSYWLYADGDLNPQWRRVWTEPPWPKRRRRALAPTSSRPLIKASISTDDDNRISAKTEARRAAERLFERPAA